MKISLVPNKAHLQRMRELPRAIAPVLSDPVLLRALGKAHRWQEETIFASEGAAGGAGPWASLNPRYAARKAREVGSRRKILVLTGETKRRFTMAGAVGYIQRFIPRGALGTFQFGAASAVAAAHRFGDPSLAPGQSSAVAKKIFGGRAPRLPVRDMVTKSAAQLAELREVLLTWYIARVKQQARAGGRLRGRT